MWFECRTSQTHRSWILLGTVRPSSACICRWAPSDRTFSLHSAQLACVSTTLWLSVSEMKTKTKTKRKKEWDESFEIKLQCWCRYNYSTWLENHKKIMTWLAEIEYTVLPEGSVNGTGGNDLWESPMIILTKLGSLFRQASINSFRGLQ